MFKTYKYRLYPTKAQSELIDTNIRCARFVYNLALETKIMAYSGSKINLSGIALIGQLPELKKECPWLMDANAQSLQQSIHHLDSTFDAFVKGQCRFPKFKKKNGKQTFNVPQNVRINYDKNEIFLTKIRWIKLAIHRKINGQIRNCTVLKTSTGKYFALILVENGIELPEKHPIKNSIGIDLGLNHFIITNTGLKIDNPRFLKESIGRLRYLQRLASKKKLGSQNRKKANLRVAKQHEKVTNRRLDFIHKVTSRLVSDNQTDTFFMEDLNVKGMITCPRLGQAITDVSWSEFKRQMKYKCDWKGKNLILIDRFAPSSKTCSCCGHKKETLLMSERIFNCENCGLVIDRDINAAINIKNFGLKKHSGQGLSVVPVELLTVVGTVKQELVDFI